MQNKNPYENQQMSQSDFLQKTYLLMRKKILRLIDIENSKVRNKIPLPVLKEKLEIISNVLKALSLLMDSLDYNNPMGVELSNIFNDFGILLTLANISKNKEAISKYNIVIAILDEFLVEV